MATLKSFDPTRCKVIIALNEVIGYAPDTKFTVAPTNSRKTVTEGVDGDISVNVDSRYSGTLTINLLQNATFNKFMQDLALGGNLATFPFFPVTIVDPTSDYFLNTIGWIQEQPEHGVAQETSTKSWVIGLKDTRGQSSEPVAVGTFVQNNIGII